MQQTLRSIQEAIQQQAGSTARELTPLINQMQQAVSPADVQLQPGVGDIVEVQQMQLAKSTEMQQTLRSIQEAIQQQAGSTARELTPLINQMQQAVSPADVQMQPGVGVSIGGGDSEIVLIHAGAHDKNRIRDAEEKLKVLHAQTEHKYELIWTWVGHTGNHEAIEFFFKKTKI